MAEINVVPYIDVMLVLLVIFMITAPMLTQGITVDLPQAQSEEISTAEQEPVIVSVDSHGLYYLNISDQPDIALSAQDIVLQVAAELQIAREKNLALPVFVKGDKTVHYGKVVTAMLLLKQAGADKVGLVTENTQENV
ncbi:MAG: protein TolR [Legionellaceae bacterium]|nr:protein TolR [Legionellaceae bacterium]